MWKVSAKFAGPLGPSAPETAFGSSPTTPRSFSPTSEKTLPAAAVLKRVPRLTLVTQNDLSEAYLKDLARWARAGNLSAIQLRAKGFSPSALLQGARRLRELLASTGTRLIINDHPQVAFQALADGVHLGQDDPSPAAARDLLGPEKLIGWSVNTWADLEAANRSEDLDYVGASAIFPTANKSDQQHFWGLDGLAHLVTRSRYPVVAIGGLNLANAQAVRQTGAHGLAVIGAIHQAADPPAAIVGLQGLWTEDDQEGDR